VKSPASTGLNFIVANVSGPWIDLTNLGVEIRQYGSDDRELLFPKGWKQNYNPTTAFSGYRVVEIENSTGTKVQLYYPVLAGGLQIPAVAGSFRII
jgi:hypothetical protein